MIPLWSRLFEPGADGSVPWIGRIRVLVPLPEVPIGLCEETCGLTTCDRHVPPNPERDASVNCEREDRLKQIHDLCSYSCLLRFVFCSSSKVTISRSYDYFMTFI